MPHHHYTGWVLSLYRGGELLTRRTFVDEAARDRLEAWYRTIWPDCTIITRELWG